MTTAVPLFLHGKSQNSATTEHLDVINPATQAILAKVPLATDDEIEQAVTAASAAFKSWRNTPALQRSRLMMRYQALLKEHQKSIATILSQETGKIFDDAMGDVWRGIEVAEQAANITTNLLGDSLKDVASNIDTICYRYPLGVCLGITPFNFPAMIPLWMFPLAIACGNTFILKPSEQDPMTSVRLAELFYEAGAPENILQI
ncbi:MAG: aldehyde dehydrogenase family protein, partial [Endozoicomonadaceae bacterium]|nr:aldehyde dehydrogenase family protein [Endozoicomonadaceae bacterium]MCY4330641.1 aldehyde dehydrogenase family protein [Endozoicomonadaceae bacterium]